MLFTSYYAKKSIKDCRRYSISNSSSRWISIRGKITELVPPWEIVEASKSGKITKSEYTTKYIEYLDSVDWDSVLPRLKRYESMEEKVVLLCWEKSSDFCHRHILRKYLRERFNLEIHELK